MSMQLYHQSKLALGSDTTLVVVSNKAIQIVEKYLDTVWQQIFSFERSFSRFLPNSELSQFNQNAGMRQRISPAFKNILTCAKTISETTEGLFNPFVLPLIQNVGYKGSSIGNYGNEPEIDFSKRSCTAIKNLEVGNNWACIPYGTAIDLGGCGKGYIADAVIASGMPDWIRGFWFSFGGDVVGGGEDEAGQAWTVNVSDRLDPMQPAIGKFISRGEVFHIATSSVQERRGQFNGKAWHHIIDPRSQQPAYTNVSGATVVAATLVEADVFATCSIILGRDQTFDFLHNNGVESAVLIVRNLDDTLSYEKYGTTIQIYDRQSKVRV